MAVYVDAAIWSWAGLKWCHLLADDMDVLHPFCGPGFGIDKRSARFGRCRRSGPGSATTAD